MPAAAELLLSQRRAGPAGCVQHWARQLHSELPVLHSGLRPALPRLASQLAAVQAAVQTSPCVRAQVCTGVMLHGYPMVKRLCGELQTFMARHGFDSIADFRGASLPYFTTHQQLVALQREAIDHRKKVPLPCQGLQCLQ